MPFLSMAFDTTELQVTVLCISPCCILFIGADSMRPTLSDKFSNNVVISPVSPLSLLIQYKHCPFIDNAFFFITFQPQD